MFKLLAVFSLTTGCIAISSPSREVEQLKRDFSSEKDLVNDRLLQVNYFIEHDKCFINYGICLGEGNKTKKECWNLHEQCVVSVYRKWKSNK